MLPPPLAQVRTGLFQGVCLQTCQREMQKLAGLPPPPNRGPCPWWDRQAATCAGDTGPLPNAGAGQATCTSGTDGQWALPSSRGGPLGETETQPPEGLEAQLRGRPARPPGFPQPRRLPTAGDGGLEPGLVLGPARSSGRWWLVHPRALPAPREANVPGPGKAAGKEALSSLLCAWHGRRRERRGLLQVPCRSRRERRSGKRRGTKRLPSLSLPGL